MFITIMGLLQLWIDFCVAVGWEDLSMMIKFGYGKYLKKI